MRKVFTVLISAILLCSMIVLSACGGGGIGGVKIKYERVNYDVNEATMQIMIGAWWSPLVEDAAVKSVAENGINTLFVDHKAGSRTSENYKYMFDLLAKYNIKGITNTVNAAGSIRETSTVLTEGFDWTTKTAYFGSNFYDEPRYEQIFDYLSTYVEEYNQKYSGYAYFNNLWPIYLGARHVPDYDNNTYIDKSQVARYPYKYYEYLDAYGREVLSKLDGERWLSVDHYPLMVTSKGTFALRDNWLLDLETIKIVANKYNAKAHLFIQSTDQTGLADGYRKDISYDLMAWQVYSLMSFGFEGFSHFLYYLPNVNDNRTMLAAGNMKTPVWYSAEKINKEALNFDHVYLSFDWEGIKPIYATDNVFNANANLEGIKNPLSELSNIKSITSSQDLLCGQFKDAKDNKAFMITNFNDADLIDDENDYLADITLTFSGYSGAIVYYHGHKIELISGGSSQKSSGFSAEFEFRNGVLNVKNLEAGQGIFVIPTL